MLSKIWVWDPEKIYSGSQIQGSKRHRIPDPDPQLKSKIRLFTIIPIRILLLITVTRICDHWSTDPPGSFLSRHASNVSVPGSISSIWRSTLMRIRLQLFTLLRIRMQLSKIMRIRIRIQIRPCHIYTCRQRGRAKTVASFFQVKLMASEDVEAALDNQSIN
jgi:hypothetical protein